MTDNHLKFYIDGAWVNPRRPNPSDVINPATEEVVAQISLGSADDVDDAVAAARRAFESYSMTSREDRLRLLRRIVEVLADRKEALARAITTEIGAPISLSRGPQTTNAVQHFSEAIATLSKLAPALAAGCTVVLKPSEVSPLSALVLAEVLHEAGLPKGVFNLVNGDGHTVGSAIAQHVDVDMVSFTGSTKAGIHVAKSAADTVKRVTQELGGKSPYLVMRNADLQMAVSSAILRCFANSGQVCQAPTRLLIHQSQYESAVAIAHEAADKVKIGDPQDPATSMGPLVNKAQFDRVQYYIQKGIDEGARLVAGGLGRPSGLNRGYYVRPTVFSNVMPTMTIAREEIFGPVMSIIEYQADDEAISIANDTPFGLAAYVHAGNVDEAKIVASKIRAGRVYLNDAPADRSAPFGGYKQSGNGREQGVFGFEEYLEVKAILGVSAA
jgi:aldehyde dehydrogenase (NAD+)